MLTISISSSNYQSSYSAIRWNGYNRALEIMDPNGGTWTALALNAFDSTNGDIDELLAWVRATKQKQQELAQLRLNHPALDSALNQVDVVYNLVKK